MKSVIKIVLPVLILGAGIAAFMTLKASREQAGVLKVPEKQWLVATETVERRDIHPLARLYGRIESPVESTLRAAVEAEVIRVNVREGAFVHRGELLVELDGGDLELTLSQRESDLRELEARVAAEGNRRESNRAALEDETALLELARRNLQRARRLASTQAGSEAAVDDALQIIRTRSLAVVQRQLDLDDHPSRLAQLEASKARARAARDQVQRDLERTGIRAPFDGRVTAVDVSRGGRVSIGDALLTLFDTGAVEVRAQIPERFLGAVRGSLAKGLPVSGNLVLEGSSYPVRLTRLAGSIRPGQGGLDGFFGFVESESPVLETGRVAALNVELPVVRDAISVPVAALYGTDTVYVVVEGRMSGRPVTYVGEHETSAGETRALIVSAALADGDTLVQTQIPAAVEGLRVAEEQR